jgi:predicted carbohydrate-binding protein with CBM5 and CBM33 domain
MGIDSLNQPVSSEEEQSQDEKRVEQPDTQEQPDMCEAEVSVPLANHTGTSIRNLVTMIYSRGSLLSKATGGNFACSVELIDELGKCITVEDAVARLTPDLTGLTIADDKINFVFPATDDADKVQAFTQLAAQMNKAAKKQKRVMAKKVDTTNERYSMRIWLLALGMSGDEFKTARRVLLAPLSGNAAFKDAAMEQRWKEKRAGERKAADEQDAV